MKKLIALAGALVLVAAGLVAAYVIEKRHAARNIRGSSTVEFSTIETIRRACIFTSPGSWMVGSCNCTRPITTPDGVLFKPPRPLMKPI